MYCTVNSQLSSQSRVAWMDSAKALGIFLVVYGHSLATGWGIGKWIYSFHMPFFFIISGYLTKFPASQSAPNYLLKRFIFLMGNYFTFAMLGYVFWLLVQKNFGETTGMMAGRLDPVLATIYGTGTPADFSVIPRFLWFLPCLAVAQVLLFFIYKLRRSFSRWIILITCAWAGFTFLSPYALPFEIETSCVAVLFMAVGYEIRVHDILGHIHHLSGLILLVVGTLCGLGNSGVDMRASQFGSPFLFLVSSLFISTALLCFCKTLPSPGPMIQLLSKNSLYILGLHSIVTSVFCGLYQLLDGLSLGLRENTVFGFLESVAIVFVIAWFSPFTAKVFPWTVRSPS